MISNRARHKPLAGHAGFSLIEMVVVLAIMGIVVGAAAPLVSMAVDQSRREEVLFELRELSTALQEYYHDNASFPASLTATDFLGVYVISGFQNSAVNDGWGPNTSYIYTTSSNPDSVTLRSRGPNAIDDSGAIDDIQVTVPGTVAGNRRTRERTRMIVEVLANFIEAGGLLTGTWSTDRAAMGLGSAYETDGFGTSFQLDATTYVLLSAGPDRSFGTADDLSN